MWQTKLAAGVAGAAIGGLIGNRIGASMDEEDKRRAYAAQMQALESGRSERGLMDQATAAARLSGSRRAAKTHTKV